MSHQHRCQKNHWLANCELVKVTSGHDGRDSIPRLCLECRQPCGVVGGTWKWKLLTRRTKGKGTLDPPDKALLTVCLSSFSLSYSFSSFPICISSYLPLLLLERRHLQDTCDRWSFSLHQKLSVTEGHDLISQSLFIGEQLRFLWKYCYILLSTSTGSSSAI